jgi:CelD/BcsL family acetyltransferase involved in cellulose biosynthesis
MSSKVHLLPGGRTSHTPRSLQEITTSARSEQQQLLLLASAAKAMLRSSKKKRRRNSWSNCRRLEAMEMPKMKLLRHRRMWIAGATT